MPIGLLHHPRRKEPWSKLLLPTGKVLAVSVNDGDPVEDGDTIVILEAMKMEHRLRAETAGTIERIAVATGQQVNRGDVLIEIAPSKT